MRECARGATWLAIVAPRGRFISFKRLLDGSGHSAIGGLWCQTTIAALHISTKSGTSTHGAQ
jgi:hypothetical protein